MKTIREHLETLPEPYRSQALENIDERDQDLPEISLRGALLKGFFWYDAPQGGHYWIDVYHRLVKGELEISQK